jgi:hypothetical protein
LPNVRRQTLLLLFLIGVSSAVVAGAELSDAASRAYSEYFERAQRSFLDRLSQLQKEGSAGRAALEASRAIVRPGGGDGILDAPGGLLHHWRAELLIPGVTLDRVIGVSRDYRDYPNVFHPIISSTVLSEEGDSLRVQFRMKESAGGLTATLDVRTLVHYVRLDAKRAYVISRSDEIREVENAGRPTERQLPAGRDSGYLWRAGAFTRFVEEERGVMMEMETLGLSRRFPPLLGWLIEPIARRVGRRSVEVSLLEFRRAVLKRQP